MGVARLAKRYGITVPAFAGSVTKDAAECNSAGIDVLFPIVQGVTTLEEAMDPENAKENGIMRGAGVSGVCVKKASLQMLAIRRL